MHKTQDPQAPDANNTPQLDTEAIKQQLEQLAMLDAAQREVHLQRLAAQSPALVAALRPLVEQLDAPTLLPPVARAMQTLLDDAPHAEQRLGPWQLERELGRGGMGVVHLAHRADGHYERHVAVKLIHGTQSDALLSEVRLLARLNHPHIAQLIDAGLSPQGQAYLVMEWVPEGRPLTQYAREHNCSTRERIQLMLQLCDAVAYAHRHLVIHRDLKPGNVLVNAEGQVKLLDFGVARLLDQDPEHTRQLAGYTPSYASPEQLRQLALSTASDVFSLGVMLFELLLGRHPYRRDEETAPDYTTRLLSQSPAIDWPAGTRLDADLRAVLAQALALDQERRSASVEALAADLRAWLDEMPVQARGPSLAYRSRKFIARHRWITATAALGLAGTLGFAFHAMQSAREAQAQRELAEARLHEVRSFARKVIEDYDSLLVNVPGTLKARERMVRDALDYLDRQSAQASIPPELRAELADGYGRIVAIQSYSDAFTGLGLEQSARANAVKAWQHQKILCDTNTLLPDRPHPCFSEIGPLIGVLALTNRTEYLDQMPALLQRAESINQRLSTAGLNAEQALQLLLFEAETAEHRSVVAALRDDLPNARKHAERSLKLTARIDVDKLPAAQQEQQLSSHITNAVQYGKTRVSEGWPQDLIALLGPEMPKLAQRAARSPSDVARGMFTELQAVMARALLAVGQHEQGEQLALELTQTLQALHKKEQESVLFLDSHLNLAPGLLRSLRLADRREAHCKIAQRIDGEAHTAKQLSPRMSRQWLHLQRELAHCAWHRGDRTSARRLLTAAATRKSALYRPDDASYKNRSGPDHQLLTANWLDLVRLEREAGHQGAAEQAWRQARSALEGTSPLRPEQLRIHLALWYLADGRDGRSISEVSSEQAQAKVRQLQDEIRQLVRSQAPSGVPTPPVLPLLLDPTRY